MNKTFLLTIDDGPSCHTNKKIKFLATHQIPALFFLRGEHIARYPQQAINLIRNGFLVGNHSFSHPYFSQISLEQCLEEINKTEKLINQCYHQAGIQRPYKIIRLPFADRGAGAWNRQPDTTQEQEKYSAIQIFLKNQGFINPIPDNDGIDALWDLDTQDYKSKYIQNPQDYAQNLKTLVDAATPAQNTILLHDFDHNHHLFEISIDLLNNLNSKFNHNT